ncbi:YbjN domain-containing protein [Cellulomonas sp. NPDC089187]|uniref:YbjN domain-containing protein n=1 Tax=Cellulomonas sp. NPDC089187 TaxID=3154970 RepID=UPI00344341EE
MTARSPGWLSRVLGAPVAPVRPVQDRPTRLTQDRVAAALSSHDYHFRVDDDGDLTGVWNQNRFWFFLLGDDKELFQVRGRWHRQLPVEARRSGTLALNDWNRDRIWPKLYLREEQGELAVYAEVSTDLEHGVTAEQLDQLISCGIGTGVQAFEALDALLPPAGTD